MEVYNYNKEFNNQFYDIMDGKTKHYFSDTKTGFAFNNFKFFYEYCGDIDILESCYINFDTSGNLVIKKKQIDINIKDELDKINKFLFLDNNIERYKQLYNDINYYNQLKSIDETDFGEDIVQNYKESLNVTDDMNDYIDKKNEELQELHNSLRYYILLKQYIKDIYEGNIDIYENILSKNDYNIDKQQDLLNKLIFKYKETKEPTLIQDIYNLSRIIGYLDDNLVFIKKTNKIGKIIDKSNPLQIKVTLLFDKMETVTVSIDEIEPYLSLSKNKILIEKIYNNILISNHELDKIKVEAGLKINLDSYLIDINQQINNFKTINDIKSNSFKESLPDIDGINKDILQNILINIIEKTEYRVKKLMINSEQYNLLEEDEFMYKMEKSLCKENILEDDIIIIDEYPKTENELSPLSLLYNHVSNIEFEEQTYPTIVHYCYSNGVFQDYKHQFFQDSDMGIKDIKDKFRWGYNIIKIVNSNKGERYGIKKNNINEQDYFLKLKEIMESLIYNDLELQELLKSTGDKYILYRNKNKTGTYLHGIHLKNNIYGFNLVGKYLMEIRNNLLNITETPTEIEVSDNIGLIYYKNISNLDFSYDDLIISSYYLSNIINVNSGSYYLEKLNRPELNTFLDEYTLNGIYRYLLNDSCDIRILEQYSIKIKPFEILGRNYYSINHAIISLKYMYYNNPYLSPYYTQLLKKYGKSFSIPEEGEIYDHDNYLLNSVEILNLKPPINIDSIPDYWKTRGDNDTEIGSIIHKFLLHYKFKKYPIFNALCLKLSDVSIYDEIKNTILIKNNDLMEVFSIINGGIETCYFTDIIKYLIKNKTEYYDTIIFTIINNILHKNKLKLIDDLSQLYEIITIDSVLEYIDIYDITKQDILIYLTDNFITILHKTVKHFIENSHYEFIQFILEELKKNNNNLNTSNREYILSIIKLLYNNKDLTDDDLEDKLDEKGILYNIEDLEEDNDYEEDSFEIKQPLSQYDGLIKRRDELIELFDGIDFEPKLFHNIDSFIIKGEESHVIENNSIISIVEYPVESELINILSIYSSLNTLHHEESKSEMNVKYDSEEPDMLDLYHDLIMQKYKDYIKQIPQYKEGDEIDYDIINKDFLYNIIILELKDGLLYVKQGEQIYDTDRYNIILLKYTDGKINRYLRLMILTEGDDGEYIKYI